MQERMECFKFICVKHGMRESSTFKCYGKSAFESRNKYNNAHQCCSIYNKDWHKLYTPIDRTGVKEYLGN